MPNQNLYSCPNCGQSGVISDIRPLFDDARYDVVSCPACSAAWRVYYKMTNASSELVFVPDQEKTDSTEGEESKENSSENTSEK